MRGVFVTGTDTGVGKTAVAGAVCAALAARGQDVAAFKPVVTGTDEVSAWPPTTSCWQPRPAASIPAVSRR